ncbi:hypothetical protein MTO96_034828 [Rhipicephalus appendiculatus]
MKQGASVVIRADAASALVASTKPANNVPATPVENSEDAVEVGPGSAAAKRACEESVGEGPSPGTSGTGRITTEDISLAVQLHSAKAERADTTQDNDRTTLGPPLSAIARSSMKHRFIALLKGVAR